MAGGKGRHTMHFWAGIMGEIFHHSHLARKSPGKYNTIHMRRLILIACAIIYLIQPARSFSRTAPIFAPSVPETNNPAPLAAEPTPAGTASEVPVRTPAPTNPAMDAAAPTNPAMDAAAPTPTIFTQDAPTPTPVPKHAPFSILWLSDTQRMAFSYPWALAKMGNWVARHRARRNILLAVQTGDAVEHGGNPIQWEAFDQCLGAFSDQIPFFAIAGNHDLGVREKDYRWFLERPYIQSLPPERTYEGGKAAYTTLSVGGRDFLILGAGWDTELAAVDWMNSVLQAHPDHTAILLFHTFIDREGKLTPLGKALYPLVVEPNPNVRMVLCGHIPGHFSRTDQLDDDGDGSPDRKVHIMLYNFQHYTARCGQLRLLTFDPATGSVSVETYSPVTDVQYRAYPYQEPVYTVEALF